MAATIAGSIRGFVWGGAIGDAIGSRVKIHGGSSKAALRISARTQTTLFVVESLLRSFMRANMKGIWPDFVSVTDHGLARWLATQGEVSRRWKPTGETVPYDGWLITSSELWRRADPSVETVQALLGETPGTLSSPSNSRRGSSSIALAAVAGIGGRPVDEDRCREIAQGIMALTHGHAEAIAVAGAVAVLVRALVHDRDDWPSARRRAAAVAAEHLDTPLADECPFAFLAVDETDAPLGDGTTAASALTIALRAVQRATTFHDVLAVALEHGGAVRTTCQLAGAFAGARHGEAFVPSALRSALVERWTVTGVANDAAVWMAVDPERQPSGQGDWCRYPGW